MHIITYIYIYISYIYLYPISISYILYLYPISISIYLYLSLSISIYIYLYLSISIYLYLSLSISIYLYLSLSISLSIFMAFYLSMVELKNTTMVNPGDLLWTWPYNHCRYIADILQIYLSHSVTLTISIAPPAPPVTSFHSSPRSRPAGVLSRRPSSSKRSAQERSGWTTCRCAKVLGQSWIPSTNGDLYGYGSIPINTIFSGMNIHLPAILMFTRGTRFWHTAIWIYGWMVYGFMDGLWMVYGWIMGYLSMMEGMVYAVYAIVLPTFLLIVDDMEVSYNGATPISSMGENPL